MSSVIIILFLIIDTSIIIFLYKILEALEEIKHKSIMIAQRTQFINSQINCIRDNQLKTIEEMKKCNGIGN